MEALNRKQTSSKNNSTDAKKSQIGDAANELLSESKKLANELYEEGLNKLTEAEQQLKDYSEHLINKVQEKPLSTLLIAGGIGFLLAKLIKKQ
jgi:ElaB/YqjD/DUF883 family membrane-anchored ribosome-binding protein